MSLVIFIEKNKTCEDCEEEKLYLNIDKTAVCYKQKRWDRDMGIKFLPPQTTGALPFSASSFQRQP